MATCFSAYLKLAWVNLDVNAQIYPQVSLPLYKTTAMIGHLERSRLSLHYNLPSNIIPLHEMAQHIEMATNNKILKFNNYKRSSIYIKDEELAFIDGLIIDSFINRLISNDTYTPSAIKG